MKCINFILITSTILLISCKDSIKSEQKIEQKSEVINNKALPLIDSFFNRIKNNNHELALAELLSGNKEINTNDSSSINLRSQYNEIFNVSGEFVNSRLLKQRSIGDDLAAYVYLVKFDKKFYRFLFFFYNNGKAIVIYKFQFDSNIDIEVEESLKYYIN